MPGQTRTHKEVSRREEMVELADEDVKATSQTPGNVTAEIADDWLDSIDEALNEWAHSDELARAFVAAYQQKGGQ